MNRAKMANLLIELRKNKDLTQQDVAELFYVSPQAVSKWEKGDSIPDIETLEKISKFYQISIEEILNGEINQKENIGVLDENSNSGDIKTTASTPKKLSVPGIVIYSVSLLAFFIFLFIKDAYDLFLNDVNNQIHHISLADILTSNNYRIGNFMLFCSVIFILGSLGLGLALSINNDLYKRPVIGFLRDLFSFISLSFYCAFYFAGLRMEGTISLMMYVLYLALPIINMLAFRNKINFLRYGDKYRLGIIYLSLIPLTLTYSNMCDVMSYHAGAILPDAFNLFVASIIITLSILYFYFNKLNIAIIIAIPALIIIYLLILIMGIGCEWYMYLNLIYLGLFIWFYILSVKKKKA